MKLKITVWVTILACLCYACNNGSKSTSSTQDAANIVLMEAPPTEIDKAKGANDTLSEKAFNTEDYDNIIENKFLSATQNPLSTFSIDVDEASYSNVRRYINEGSLPPAGAVRIE